MNFMDKYGELVGRFPWVFITAIIVLTLVMGFFAGQVEMSSSEGDFEPDNEAAKANTKIMEEYGMQGASFIAVLESDNVLTKDSMIALLDFENELLNSDLKDNIQGTPEVPSGVTSPANMMAQGIYMNKAMALIMSMFAPPADNQSQDNQTGNGTRADSDGNSSGGQGGDDPMSAIQRTLMMRLFTLSIDERKTIFNGGEVALDLTNVLGMKFNLSFEEFDPGKIDDYLEGSPFKEAIPLMYSMDYLENEGVLRKASYCIFMININDTLSQGELDDSSDIFEGEAADIEKDHPAIKLRIFTNSLINKAILNASNESMVILMTISLVLVIVVLGITYRKFSDTFLNLISLVMAIIWTYGLGVVLGYTFNTILTIVPVLIIGLGIDYGIHLTVRYREEVNKGKDVRAAVKKSVGHVGFALLLATITTIMGFLSNLTAEIQALRQFGILCAAGVVSAFIIMLSFNPAIRRLLDERADRLGKLKRTLPVDLDEKDEDTGEKPEAKERKSKPEKSNWKKKFNPGRFTSKNPWIVVGIVFLISGGALYGSLNLETEFDFRDFLPKDLEVTKTLNIFMDEFNFSQEEAYVLMEGDVASPEVFLMISDIQDRANESKYIVRSEPMQSPVELAKLLSDPNGRRYDPAVAKIWDEQIDRDGDGEVDLDVTRSNITALYDGLYVNPANQAQNVLHKKGGAYDGIVIRVMVNTQNSQKVEKVYKDMQYAAKLPETLEGKELDDAIATGGPIVMHVIMSSINENQMRSVILTFAVSLFILTVLYLILISQFPQTPWVWRKE